MKVKISKISKQVLIVFFLFSSLTYQKIFPFNSLLFNYLIYFYFTKYDTVVFQILSYVIF